MTVAGIGHNGGEPLEPDPAPMLARDAACLRCQHWQAPDDRDVNAYDHWRATGRGQRRKEPAGACDRVRLSPSSAPAFSATLRHSRCLNYEPKPVSAPARSGRGFVTIYEGGRIVWQGTDGTEPAEFRQGELFQ